MIKLTAAALLLALSALGCSTCSDGSQGMGLQVGPVGAGTSRYRACADECCQPDPKKCGCSNACPCWRRHP